MLQRYPKQMKNPTQSDDFNPVQMAATSLKSFSYGTDSAQSTPTKDYTPGGNCLTETFKLPFLTL